MAVSYGRSKNLQCSSKVGSATSFYWTPFSLLGYFLEAVFELRAGNDNWTGRLSTIDLLIKVACFVKSK